MYAPLFSKIVAALESEGHVATEIRSMHITQGAVQLIKFVVDGDGQRVIEGDEALLYAVEVPTLINPTLED